MTASVAFDAQAAQGKIYTLPATALFHDGAEPAVWVVKAPDDVLELRRVTLGRYDALRITVTGGLARRRAGGVAGRAHGLRGREGAAGAAAASRGDGPVTAPEQNGRFNLSAWTLRHQPLVIFLIGIGDDLRRAVVLAPVAIGGPALHLPRDGDPDASGRAPPRASVQEQGHRPHRPQAAGGAQHGLHPQLFAPRASR